MQTIDERYRMLGQLMGAERIRLNKAETATLKRAHAILSALRTRRAAEYHARGHGETLEHADDIADEVDNLNLAVATTRLSEVIEEGSKAKYIGTGGENLAWDILSARRSR